MNIHLDIVALRNKIGAIQQTCDEATDGLDQLEQKLELEFRQKNPERIYVNIYRHPTQGYWTSVWKTAQKAREMAEAYGMSQSTGDDPHYLTTKEIIL